MQIETTEIAVRGKGSVEATLKYSRHGPILYEDRQNRLAYGMRAAWLDIGATPYLASLRMDQATTWEEFREACPYSGLPGENMVWADKAGNIGWQSVGLAPVRFGWDGSLPVPGNGDYEWNGYIPITSMPHIENPEEGWYGTTNNHNIPEGYPNVFSNAYRDPARIFRLREVMNATSEHTVEDSMTLQYDKKSMTAESLAPLFQGLRVRGKLGEANLELTNWDYDMDRDSVAAAIYDQWELAMLSDLKKRVVPADNLDSEPAISKVKMLEWLLNPSEFVFGRKPEKSRDKAIIASLDLAVNKLEEMIGPDMHEWSLGKIHRADVIHPLSHLVGPELKAKINVAPLPRGGANNTLNVNWGNDRQLAGASFRIIVDTSDWDLARGTNSPGQSGNPDSPHYADLFKGWNEGDYFEVLYSRDRISAVASHVTHLLPGRK